MKPLLSRGQALALLVSLFVLAAVWGKGGPGEVPLTLATTAEAEDFIQAGYELTSDTYLKWLDAQENLRRESDQTELGVSVQSILLTDPTPDVIDRVVQELEQDERRRNAIESAGLTIREYVLATLAIYQAADLTRGPAR